MCIMHMIASNTCVRQPAAYTRGSCAVAALVLGVLGCYIMLAIAKYNGQYTKMQGLTPSRH